MNALLAKLAVTDEKLGAQFARNRAAVKYSCGHGSRFRVLEVAYLERVRREIRVGRHFGPAEFERAFGAFQQMYHVRPSSVLCAPDVLERFSEIYGEAGQAHVRDLRFEGVRVSASVIAPGMVAFEGEVDEDRMGDW
jgi:hypothetical protein